MSGRIDLVHRPPQLRPHSRTHISFHHGITPNGRSVDAACCILASRSLRPTSRPLSCRIRCAVNILPGAATGSQDGREWNDQAGGSGRGSGQTQPGLQRRRRLPNIVRIKSIYIEECDMLTMSEPQQLLSDPHACNGRQRAWRRYTSRRAVRRTN